MKLVMQIAAGVFLGLCAFALLLELFNIMAEQQSIVDRVNAAGGGYDH